MFLTRCLVLLGVVLTVGCAVNPGYETPEETALLDAELRLNRTLDGRRS